MAGFGVALLSALAKAPGAYQESRGREIDLGDKEADAFGRAAGANALAILSKGPLGMPGGGMPGGMPPGGAPGGAGAGPQPMPPGVASQPMPPPMPPPQLGQGPAPGMVNPARIGGQPQNLTGPTIMPPSGGPPNGPPAAPPGLPQPPQQAGGMPPRGMMPVPRIPPQMAQPSQMAQQQPRQLGQPPQPQGGAVRNGPLDWRQAIQAIQQSNPGISPRQTAAAMKFMLPYMTLDSKLEWMQAHNQYLENQLLVRQRGQDIGLQKTEETLGTRVREGEANRSSREGIAGRREEGLGERQTERLGAQAEQGERNRENRLETAKLRARGNVFAQVGPDGKYQMTPADMDRALAIRNGWEDPKSLSRAAGYQPQTQAILEAARNMAKKDGENWDESSFSQRKGLETKFTSGPQADKIRSIGTAQRHLDTLVELSKAIDNNNTQTINNIIQAVKREFGNTKITSAEAASQIIAGELVKAIVNSGGGVRDRAEMETHIDPAKMTLDQILDNAETLNKLLEGQTEGWRRQYNAVEKRTGKNFDDEFGITKHNYSRGTGGGASGPSPGTVEDGYRFKGGDPGDPNSWEKT